MGLIADQGRSSHTTIRQMSRSLQNDSAWWKLWAAASFSLSGAASSPKAPCLSQEGLLGEEEMADDSGGGHVGWALGRAQGVISRKRGISVISLGESSFHDCFPNAGA